MLQGFERLLGRTVKEGDSRGELEARKLAAGEGMLDLFQERGDSRMRGMRGGKVTSGSGKRAEEGRGGSGRHAAKPKAAMPQR
jgi:hypothetical protein